MNTIKITRSRFILTTILAWLLFLAVDFLAHASLLKSYWAQKLPALKSDIELFRLIPFGYLSFLLLTVLVGWLYVRLYGDNGNTVKGLSFGAVFGGFFGGATFLGWYSALNIPLLFVFLIGLVYFIELLVVGFTYGYLLHSKTIKKRVLLLVAFVILGLILGIVFQNI